MIRSILIAICRYWSVSYFLYRRVIKEVEKILKTFMWACTKKAKVKWANVCQPKSKGSLDIPDHILVNYAYTVKNL